MNKEELKKIWEAFTEKNDFKLNPDEKVVDMIAEGVFRNEEKFGLKICPCWAREGTIEDDIANICPCNFKTHDSWKEKGSCRCSLFVKRE